jgi:hypothetical protein
MPEPEVVTETPAEAPKIGVREPKEDSIEHAVSRLMGEPEETQATSESEPEEIAEEAEPEEGEVESELEPEETEEEEPTEEHTEEEESTEETEELAYYSVKVDGEELEVTLDELRSGYQRQQDYTRKTQALAEERKESEAKRAQQEELHQNFLQQASLANELLNRDIKKFERVDWETLKVEDPVGYVQKQIDLQEVRTQQATLQAQMQQVYESNLKSQQEERAKHVESQKKEALKLFPDWKSPEKMSKGQQRIAEYARGIGYDDMQLANIIDARDLAVLDKARQWDEYQANRKEIPKKKAQPSVRKVVKSKGKASVSTSKKKSITDKHQKLRKSGSLRDAAALMAELHESKAIKR